MPPTWLTVVAWIALGAAVLALADIAYDLFVRGHRQKMAVMDAVWLVTPLYAPGVANVAYRRWGRPRSPHWRPGPSAPDDPGATSGNSGSGPGDGDSDTADVERDDGGDDEPDVEETTLAVTHCGAGCTLGDIVGSTLVFLLGLELFGRSLWPEYAVDFTLAFALGIAFQYLTIAPMRGLGVRDGLSAAVKADTASLLSFEIGMFGWMAVVQLVFFRTHGLHPDHAAFWFLMQVGMVLGFATAYPVNVWLLRRGVKEAM